MAVPQNQNMQFPLRLFIEVILAVLGGFILWLALVSHKFPDRHALSWLILGVVLMAWGAFTFFRARIADVLAGPDWRDYVAPCRRIGAGDFASTV